MAFQLFVGETKDVPISVAGLNLTNDEAIDPSSSTVTVGFVPSGRGPTPAPGTWYPATWLVNTERQLYWASALIGPLGVTTLAVGTWVPWVSFMLGSELIQQPANDTIVVQ